MTTETLEQVLIEPFSIEVAKLNTDIPILAIPGNPKLRGPFSPMRTIKDKKTGEELIPKDQTINLSGCPATPSMQLHIDPAKLAWVITDPMRGDEELCERVRKWMDEHSPYGVSDKLDGVERKHGKLDEDQMKTLCREIRRGLDDNLFKPCRGTRPPHQSEIDDLPGDYLWNSGAVSQWNGPKYEKDYAEYRRSVEALGN